METWSCYAWLAWKLARSSAKLELKRAGNELSQHCRAEKFGKNIFICLPQRTLLFLQSNLKFKILLGLNMFSTSSIMNWKQMLIRKMPNIVHNKIKTTAHFLNLPCVTICFHKLLTQVMKKLCNSPTDININFLTMFTAFRKNIKWGETWLSAEYKYFRFCSMQICLNFACNFS